MLFSILFGSRILFDKADDGGAGGGSGDEAAKNTGKTDDQNPAWLPERLKRAEETATKKVMTELGCTLEEAKAFIAEGKKAADAKKTLEDRHAETNRELDALKARDAQRLADLKVYADGELAKLTAEQQAAVKQFAGDDPAAQLKAIASLMPTWKTSSSGGSGGSSGDDASKSKSAPIGPPANSTPPAGNTPPAPPAQVVDHLANYNAMKDTNPWAAQNYLALNYAAIDKARKAGGAK